MNATSPTNPKGYAVEPFVCEAAEARGRDAHPVEDDSGADVSDAGAIAMECGVEKGLVSEIILCLKERGALVTSDSFKKLMPRELDYGVLLHLKEIFAEFYNADTIIKRWALCHVLRGKMEFFGDFTQGWTQKQFADWLCDEKNPDRKYDRMTKQNICKEVRRIYEWLLKLGLDIPLPEGLRDDKSRGKMANAANTRLAISANNQKTNNEIKK
jgi:hypothetical protein